MLRPAGKNRSMTSGDGGVVASETTIKASALAAKMVATGMMPRNKYS